MWFPSEDLKESATTTFPHRRPSFPNIRHSSPLHLPWWHDAPLSGFALFLDTKTIPWGHQTCKLVPPLFMVPENNRHLLLLRATISHFIMTAAVRFRRHLRRLLLLLTSCCLLSLLLSAYFLFTNSSPAMQIGQSPEPGCSQPLSMSPYHQLPYPYPPNPPHTHVQTDPVVLVLVESQYSQLGQDIVAILESAHYQFRMEIASGKGDLPPLTEKGRGRYSLIIYENLLKYAHADTWNRQLLHQYCTDYRVGVIGFYRSTENSPPLLKLRGLPLVLRTNQALWDCCVVSSSPLLHLTKPGTDKGALPGEEWTTFSSNHSSYQALLQARAKEGTGANSGDNSGSGFNLGLQATVVQDMGLYDGVRRVLFGQGLGYWLHKLILVDAISYLTDRKLTLGLDRHILVDIDDIFVGKEGTRMTAKDVKVWSVMHIIMLIGSQKKGMDSCLVCGLVNSPNNLKTAVVGSVVGKRSGTQVHTCWGYGKYFKWSFSKKRPFKRTKTWSERRKEERWERGVVNEPVKRWIALIPLFPRSSSKGESAIQPASQNSYCFKTHACMSKHTLTHTRHI